MKWYRRYCLFLVFLSSLIPLNVAYFYYDYHSGIELQLRKHFSNQDEEGLLTLFEKNARAIHFSVLSTQNYLLFSLQIPFFYADWVVLTHPKNPVLRC